METAIPAINSQFTAEQIITAARIRALNAAERDREGDALYSKLEKELGVPKCTQLFLQLANGSIQEPTVELEKPPKPAKTSPEKPKFWKPARRVSRSPESWRILANYPNYEISSHGRVRSLDRARPDDWLKPRHRLYRGAWRSSIVLLDKDGKRRERDTGWLLVDAGFLDKPKWTKAALV